MTGNGDGNRSDRRITRRDVLRAGAAAAAAAMAGPRGTAAGDTAGTNTQPAGKAERKMDKVRIGVVGGGFGTDFQWHEHPDCVVQAVSDLRPERRERLMKVYKCQRAYESLEKLILDKEVDAVAVFTGAPDHVRHDVLCLNAGKHVISAVPAAMTLEDCQLLRETVEKTGLTYMMAETSWYHQSVISARKWFAAGKFGEIFYTEAEYHHPGLESLFFEGPKRTWRHGLPPMNYPTHCTGYLVGVTGERMTRVACTGWGDGDEIVRDNVYKNPFWNETAMFVTNKGHSFRVGVYWKGPVGGCERGQWFGQKMTYYDPHPSGTGYVIRRMGDGVEKDDAGFERKVSAFEKYDQPQWWKTEMLPAPLRHGSGHDGSHTFLTHEFVDALVHGRKPAVNVYEALALTAPGIVAHQSALKGGQQMEIPSFDPAAKT
jgi:predicted dehydrogenase